MVEMNFTMDLIYLRSQYRPCQEAVQALKDSLLNVLGKLKDDLSADSETPDNSSPLRIYNNLRKL